MEEKKNITVSSKNGEKQKKEQVGKYSYEQLNEICGKLYQDNQNLAKQLQQVSQFASFKRVEFLLKIIELSDKIKDVDFIAECIEELKETMTLPTDEAEQEESEKEE